MRWTALVVLGLAGAWACSGRSERNDDSAQTGGSAGTGSGAMGGSGGAGAAAGSGGSGAAGGTSAAGTGAGGSGSGTGGSEPEAGKSGASGTAGQSAGTAGSPPSTGGAPSTGGTSGTGGTDAGGMAGAPESAFPECETDDDCEIAEDCCTCQAVPKGVSLGVCLLDCGGSNGCAMQGLETTATCMLGRCTVAASCTGQGATCDSLPPECSPGQAPTVSGFCWGPCVAATECADVSDCSVCGEAYCVNFPDVGGIHRRCIARRPECEPGNLCDCLKPCGTYGCSEIDGEVGCYCPAC